jgi:hypothetical protein
MSEPLDSTLFFFTFIIFSLKFSQSFVVLAGARTEILFVCNASATTTNPKFMKQTGNTYVFEVQTHLACKAWPQQCMVGSLTAWLCGCVIGCLSNQTEHQIYISGVGSQWRAH